MILYFADRKTMDITGHASTELLKDFTITSDSKVEDVDTGTVSFEATIAFDKENRLELEDMAEVGNYLLRSSGEENEFYTIVESEIDTKNHEIWIYAEDAGLDLINEIAAEYEAKNSQTIEFYINRWIADSGFEIGLNECPDSTTRQLSWTGESTVTERLASIATQFGDYEISYSFAVNGLTVTNRYVNIHKQRGKDVGEQLRINKEIDRIITKKSITNLATALKCTGGTPEDSETPITLSGYSYDDGDFYVSGSAVCSRKAAEKWGRFAWAEDINAAHDGRGFIVRHYSYDTLDQATLCSHAIAELKKICDMEVNYEVDITNMPDSIKVGDRINIVDDAGELYLSTRILQLKTSEVKQSKEAVLGEYLLKESGISQTVEDLAAQFKEIAAARVFYTWIAYADDENGTGISLDPTDKTYMGTAPNKLVETVDISDPTIFTWALIKGTDGQDGVDGQDGHDGQDGLDGFDGIDGKSAYEIAVEHGFDGTEADWLESLTVSVRVGARNLIRNSKNLMFNKYGFGHDAFDPFKLDTPVINIVLPKLGRPKVSLVTARLDRPNIYLETVSGGQLDAPEIYLSTGGTSALLGQAVLGQIILGTE